MQAFATTLIVLAAFAYVAWRYLPRAWLRASAPASPRAIPIIVAPAATGCGSGCSACSGCLKGSGR